MAAPNLHQQLEQQQQQSSICSPDFSVAIKRSLFFNSFLKVATTLINLLLIEHMSHLSFVKQIYNQPIHLTHELILCTQISRKKVDINKDSAVITLCLHQVFESATQIFFELQPYFPEKIMLFSWLHTFGSHSSGQYSRGPLCSSHQQAVRNAVHPFPKPLKMFAAHLLAYIRSSHWLYNLREDACCLPQDNLSLVKRRLGHREKWLIIEIGTLSTDKKIPHNLILNNKSHAFLLQVTFTKNVP